MGLTTYVMLMFGISIAFFFLGFAPPLFASAGCNTASTTCAPADNLAYTVINNILNAIISNPAATGLAGVAVVTSIILGGSFVVIYIIPALILIAVANFVFLPTSFMFSDVLPIEIRLIVLAFLNLLLILTIVSFVRGGE